MRPGKSPIALRVRLDDADLPGDPGFDLTEAGTQKRLAVYVVRDPLQIPGIATLGPDPLDPAFDVAALTRILEGSRQQIKGLLRDQSVLAGVGNAYSDEVLHAAKLSPYAIAGKLGEGEVERLDGDAHGADRRRRGCRRETREGAQGRQARRYAGPRPRGAALPGLR